MNDNLIKTSLDTSKRNHGLGWFLLNATKSCTTRNSQLICSNIWSHQWLRTYAPKKLKFGPLGSFEKTIFYRFFSLTHRWHEISKCLISFFLKPIPKCLNFYFQVRFSVARNRTEGKKYPGSEKEKKSFGLGKKFISGSGLVNAQLYWLAEANSIKHLRTGI